MIKQGFAEFRTQGLRLGRHGFFLLGLVLALRQLGRVGISKCQQFQTAESLPQCYLVVASSAGTAGAFAARCAAAFLIIAPAATNTRLCIKRCHTLRLLDRPWFGPAQPHGNKHHRDSRKERPRNPSRVRSHCPVLLAGESLVAPPFRNRQSALGMRAGDATGHQVSCPQPPSDRKHPLDGTPPVHWSGVTSAASLLLHAERPTMTDLTELTELAELTQLTDNPYAAKRGMLAARTGPVVATGARPGALIL